MERQDRRAQILKILAKSIRRIIEEEVPDTDSLQEIRMRTGQPLRITKENRDIPVPEGKAHIVTKEEVRETLDYISRYSLYAYENELRQGFSYSGRRSQGRRGRKSDHGKRAGKKYTVHIIC